jgi:hypothetical protein
MKNKFYTIGIIIICILVIGVIISQCYDSNTIRTGLTKQAYREIHQIPDTLSDQELEDIEELIKEADIICFRLEQHRLELEKILEENK